MNLEQYLINNNFDKYFKKLERKLKNKTVIIYGAGKLFHIIKEKYNLNSFNIIGISDTKYALDQEGDLDFGYKIIPKENLKNYEPDFILIGAQEYINLVYSLTVGVYKNKKTKVLPLVKQPLFEILKKIWL